MRIGNDSISKHCVSISSRGKRKHPYHIARNILCHSGALQPTHPPPFGHIATIFPGIFYFLKEILLETVGVLLYNDWVYAAIGGISDLSREEMIT